MLYTELFTYRENTFPISIINNLYMSFTLFQYLHVYLGTTVFFFAIDMLWLGVVAKGFYQSKLASFLGPVNWLAAIVFYLLFIGGVLFFASFPAAEAASLKKAIMLGALFGFFTYMTYDLTNMATLSNWPLAVVIVDILWGMVLAGSTAVVGYYIIRAIT